MTKRRYIKPPESHECEWREGPPPNIGWWPASVGDAPTVLRWWDGRRWSAWVFASENAEAAAASAKTPAHEFMQRDIQWTDRWWGRK